MTVNASVNKFAMWLGLTGELSCIVQLGLAFMSIYAGYGTHAFISKSAFYSLSKFYSGRIHVNDGYYGMAITYLTLALSTSVISPFMINRIGPKWSMFTASIPFTIYMIVYVFANVYIYFLASALVGISTAVLWNSHGAYIKLITTEGNATRNTAIQWSMNFVCLLFYSTMLLLIFKKSPTEHMLSIIEIRLIFGGLSIFTLMANVLFFLLPDISMPNDCSHVTAKDIVLRNFKLLKDGKFILQIVCFMYCGLVTSLYLTIFPTCLIFSRALISFEHEIVACHILSFAIGQITSGLLVGLLNRKYKEFGFLLSVLITFPIHLLAYIGIFLSFPSDANIQPTIGATIISPNIILWTSIGVFIGLGDGIWSVVRTSTLITLFDHDSTQAFALCRFFQALTTCVSLFYSTFINIYIQMIIMANVLIASIASYIALWIIYEKEFFLPKKHILIIHIRD